jgi:hypothetical protein
MKEPHMRRAAAVVAGNLALGFLAAGPASAATTGQAHGTISYYQVSPKTVAQGAVTNPLTGKCYPFPEDAALLVVNETDTDAQAFASADCSGTGVPVAQGNGGLGPYGSVTFPG